MGKKQPETTYNEQEMTWNDLQRARNNMKRATRSWKDLQRSKNDLETTYNEQEATWNNPQQERQPIMTLTYLQRAKKDAKWKATSRFSDYFTIWGKRFSSLTRFPPNIWLQSFKHCFTENHGENSVKHLLSCVKRQLSCVFFTGYKIYFFLSGFRVSRERERLLF